METEEKKHRYALLRKLIMVIGRRRTGTIRKTMIIGLPCPQSSSIVWSIDAEILDANRTQEEKAELLARATIASITLKTIEKGLDGIQYLADNIDYRVITSLTNTYYQFLLQLVDNAPSLSLARLSIAMNKRIVNE